MMDLDPLDPVSVNERLSKPPFVSIAGVVNVRDLGSYPSITSPGCITRPRFIFRSAEVSSITEEGVTQLKALGVKKVFDMRSDTEIERYGTPCPELEGIEIVRVPVFKVEDYSPEMMAKRFELYASGQTEAFMELYSQILDHAGPAFGVIIRHIRDHPDDGILFHCTAGKDRTGVLAAIILKLAGVDNESIAEDYGLTRIGREPARQKVMARLAKVPLFATNTEAARNMFSSRAEVMLAFLEVLQTKYGDVVEYLKQYLELTDEDIEIVRSNLLVGAS
ncbi:hypothetical protein OBBRIDRAFT_758450 [Obba rivulosa]|uniref:Tyrosine specific protein phosphatases domain-containing protein n=1 Tax=Obba rivulosa TaxID=1052685 RepID=A0A8E2DIT6_9APHY|nr:hypothetical protein OBBRIDRAFT_758450 [Obba rivulosa]